MKNIDGRISKLEGQFGIVHNEPRLMAILSLAGMELSIPKERWIAILEEGGFLPASGACVVDLSKVPYGLNAGETERFFRENGSQICGARRDQKTTATPVRFRGSMAADQALRGFPKLNVTVRRIGTR